MAAAGRRRPGRPTAVTVITAGLFIGALGLRLWGIDFGLPHLYHPDEWQLVMPALRILQTGDPNPHRFVYGSLQIYLLTGAFALYSLYGQSRGISIHDIPVSYDWRTIENIYTFAGPGIYLTGRILTAVLGALTIPVVYLIGRRLMNRQVGLIAALLLAVSPLHVINSHYITTDVPATLFMTLSFLFTLRVLENGAHRDYAAAGMLAGLAASTKYPGGLAITALIAAHFLRGRRTFEGTKLLTGLLAGTLGFLIGTPFALLDVGAWLAWMEKVLTLYDVPGLMVGGSSAGWYLRFLLRPPYSFVTLAGILGVIWMFRNEKREGWMFVAFLIPYYGVFSLKTMRGPRTLIPVLPFLAVSAGYFVVKSSILIRRRWLRKEIREGWLVAILALLLTVAPLQASVGHAYRFTQKDVRTLAREWVLSNLPPGTRIASDFAAPVLPPDRYQVDRVGWSIVAHDVAWYREQGYEYVIVSEVMRNNENLTTEDEARYTTFLRDSNLSLVAEIEGPFLSYPGFHLWIYRIAPAKDTLSKLHQ